MSFAVNDLLTNSQFPIVAYPHESLRDAWVRMVENDFSQLPVINEQSIPIGLINTDSIIEAIDNLGDSLDDLTVIVAIREADIFSEDDDLFKLLSSVSDKQSVLILGRDKKLRAIITASDTTKYLRSRAQDIMLVEDIETSLKDYIRAVFTKQDDGGLHEERIQEIITKVTISEREQVEKVLMHYMNLSGQNAPLDRDLFEQVYQRHFDSKRQKSGFDKQTMYAYTEMFLEDSCWDVYKTRFGIKRKALRKLFSEVVDTRNQLSHFRGEISASQRAKLKYCANILAKHNKAIDEMLLNVAQAVPDSMINDDVASVESNSELTVSGTNSQTRVPVNDGILEIRELEDATTHSSPYIALGQFLQDFPTDQPVILTFKQIEKITGTEVPESAKMHRSWWSGSSSMHSHNWENSGWKVISVNTQEEKVIFAPFREEESKINSILLMIHENLSRENIIETSLSINHNSLMVYEIEANETRMRFRTSIRSVRTNEYTLIIGADVFSRDQETTLNFFKEHKKDIEFLFGERLAFIYPSKSMSRMPLRIEVSRKIDIYNVKAELIGWAVRSILRLITSIIEFYPPLKEINGEILREK